MSGVGKDKRRITSLLLAMLAALIFSARLTFVIRNKEAFN